MALTVPGIWEAERRGQANRRWRGLQGLQTTDKGYRREELADETAREDYRRAAEGGPARGRGLMPEISRKTTSQELRAEQLAAPSTGLDEQRGLAPSAVFKKKLGAVRCSPRCY